MTDNSDDSIIGKDGHVQYKSRKITWLNYVMQISICIFLLAVYCNVKKSYVFIQEELKTIAPVHITDTLYLPAPKVYYCWQCKKELADVAKAPVICCGFEYKVVNKELVAKKLGE